MCMYRSIYIYIYIYIIVRKYNQLSTVHVHVPYTYTVFGKTFKIPAAILKIVNFVVFYYTFVRFIDEIDTIGFRGDLILLHPDCIPFKDIFFRFVIKDVVFNVVSVLNIFLQEIRDCKSDILAWIRFVRRQ